MLELADIVRQAGPAFRAAHALSPVQVRALRDIAECRTATRGGQLWCCDVCSAERYVYHSCRNRHCPKCQGEHAERWLEARRAQLPDTPYYLLTFTVPATLRALAKQEPRVVLDLLMRCAANALLALCADPRFLGARPGALAVLHTWSRALLFHPHVHMLVTAGGWNPAQQVWVTPKHQRFLVPGYALSALFRGKVRAALRHHGLLSRVPAATWAKPWVVHLARAGDGQGVLRYLARYVFRVALPNSRLVRFNAQHVVFRYTDSRTRLERTCTLAPDAFLTRFVQHILPPRFVKVRHYGLFSPAMAAARARVTPPQAIDPPSVATGTDQGTPTCTDHEPRCPVCHHGTLRLVGLLPRMPRAP